MPGIGLVFRDIVHVWTQPRILAHEVADQGRGAFAFGVMGSLFVASFVAAEFLRAGLQHLHLLPPVDDLRFGGLHLTSGWASFSIFTLAVLVSFLQWLVLPFVAGKFGLARMRGASTRALYLMLALTVFCDLAWPLVDLAGALTDRGYEGWGDILVVGVSLVLIAVVVHWTTITAAIVLSAPSYGRALGALIVSLLVALFLGSAFTVVVIAVVLLFFPLCEACSS